MKSKPAQVLLCLVVIIIFVIGLGYLANHKAPSKFAGFAQCLQKNGAEFYGAFWCTHCQAQEASFVMSRESLETLGLYKECSNPNKVQNQLCNDKKIENYPTWIFKDGSRLTGEIPLATLAEKTQCVLPQ